MKSLAVIIAICLCGCATQQQLLHIDMSGKDYPQTRISINDIASVKYVLLRGTDGLSDDRSLELNYDECQSVNVTSDNIIILRRGDGLHKIETKPHLENVVYGFNRKGDFVGKNYSDTIRNEIYSYIGVSNGDRPYVRDVYNDIHTLRRKDMTTKRTNYFSKPIGSENLYFLNKGLTLSFTNCNYYLAKLGGEKIKKQQLYNNSDYGYFFINTAYPAPMLSFHRIPIYPYATKTRGGYMLTSPFTDTIKFINRIGRLNDYIINTKPRFSKTDKVLSKAQCRECRDSSSFLSSADQGMIHRDCMYGDSILRVMWPTIETKDYIFFTQASKREVITNLPARYFVYKKNEDRMYELKQENIPLSQIPLAYGYCIFKERNLTTSPNIAVEYIPYQYLKSNERLLPKDLKQLFGQLTDKDSGILMIIKYK